MQRIGLVFACVACAGHGRHTALTLAEQLRHRKSATSRKPVKANALDGHVSAKGTLTSAESLARLFLAFDPAAAFSFAGVGARAPQASPSSRRTGAGHHVPVMESAISADDFETLSDTLELAVRAEDYEKAARIQARLKALEDENPSQAMLWQQKEQVRKLVDTVLYSDEPLTKRLEAVKSLRDAALPPAAPGAEDALHKILLKIEGDEAIQVLEATTDALWTIWMISGDEAIDEEMRKGVQLMEQRQLQEAVDTFTNIIEKRPDFAEAWNKRATVYFVMKDYKMAMQDCMETLKLKPRHFGCLSGLAMCYFSKDPPDADLGLQWCQKALGIHPHLANIKSIVSKLTMKSILQEQQNPIIQKAIKAIKQKQEDLVETSDEVSCDWDVHRVGGEQGRSFKYFFRVTYRNAGFTTISCTTKSLARFYVLEFEDGKVFQFTRVTEEASPAQFALGPGEEYKFCWMLVLDKPLSGVTGGTLFEVLAGTPKKRQGFTNAGLPILRPAVAGEVSTSAEVEQLGQGHFFTGQLDLRNLGGRQSS